VDINEMIPDGKQKLKSFWQKPEGKVGIVLTAVFLGAGFIVFWAKVLPFLLLLASNTLALAAMLVVLGLIIFPFTQSDIRLRMSVAYKLFLKKLAGMIIKTDPIEVLKITITKGEERLETFEEQRSKLKQVLSNLKRKVNEYASQAKESMLAAQQAQKQQVKSQIFLNTQQAGRLQGAAVELSQVSARLETLYTVISKIYENAKTLLIDKKQEVSLLEDKWISIRAAYGAMQSAMKALQGDKDERALFEENVDFINNDLGMKVGEIEYMLEASETIMDNIDIRNGMFQDKGVKMLEEFEKKADSWLLGENTIVPQYQKTNQSGQVISNDAERPNQFSNLFGK
jgi:hypothetical protein